MAGIGTIRRTRRFTVLLIAAIAAMIVAGTVSAQASPPSSSLPWQQALNEEFTPSGLNTTLWTPHWNSPVSGTDVSGSCTNPNAVKQPGDGYLHLQLLPEAKTCNGHSHSVSGGLVTSNPLHPDRIPALKGFEYSYGYVEWRVELPVTSQPPQAPGYQITCPANGCVENWPAFWSFDQSQRTEFDVFEGLFEEAVPGTGKRVAGVGCAHFHNWDPSFGSPAPYEYPPLPKGANCKASGGGFHTYGLDWEPGVQPNKGSLKWYYDGVKIGEYESVDVKDRPQFLIADYLEPRTAYAPFILLNGGKVAEAKVDYVKVWQHAKPTVTTEPATEVNLTTAKLNGWVNPNGLPTRYYFQYGTSTSYGSTIPAAPGGDLGSGTSAIFTWNKLSGLEPGTTYHFRNVATNASGTSYGSDRQFTIPQKPHAFYVDAATKTINDWSTDFVTGWKQTFFYGNTVAAGSSPAALNIDGTLHVFYVDSGNSNTISEWVWDPSSGWKQQFFYGNSVKAGTSPSAVMVNGTPYVFYVDAATNTLNTWVRYPGVGWKQTFLYGNPVAAGSSPVALNINGSPTAYYVDAANGNTISQWSLNSSTGWKQTFLYGHSVKAGTSPTAVMTNGAANIFYVDAGTNTISNWHWDTSAGYQQTFFYGDSVAAGSSPVALSINGTPNVFYVDASKSNTITDWDWNPSTGWQQNFFYGNSVKAGTSPTATMVNGIPNVFYVDAATNTINVWATDFVTGWKQTFLYGNSVAAGSSPTAGVMG